MWRWLFVINDVLKQMHEMQDMHDLNPSSSDKVTCLTNQVLSKGKDGDGFPKLSNITNNSIITRTYHLFVVESLGRHSNEQTLQQGEI